MRTSTSLLGRILMGIASEMLEILTKILKIIFNKKLFRVTLKKAGAHRASLLSDKVYDQENSPNFKLTVLAQPLVYHAIHSDKAAREYQTLCHKPQYRLADLARGRSEESHEGKHDGCDDADQRCHLLITNTFHDKNLLLGSAPLASGE